MNIKLASIVAGVVLALSFTGGASANFGLGQTTIKPHTPTAMVFFCRKNAGECTGGGASSVRATAELVSLLNQVNKRVNSAISYRSERADVWTLNPRSGDCEDYALSKRSALIKAGVSAGALRLAVTATPRGTPHAVLIVKTSEGDMVLDNRSSSVNHLRDTGYRIQMLTSSNPLRWIAG